MNLKTHSVCMTPVVGCLDAANRVFAEELEQRILTAGNPGSRRGLIEWRAVPNNARQEHFTGRMLQPTMRGLDRFTPGEFESLASRDVKVINARLRERGFT